MERRLAAILAADVVGYSRLVHADEEGTLRTLSAYREVIDGLVSLHRGRIFGTAGDSVIVEFASPVEAVRCAVEVQQELGTRNADVPEDQRMEFRIGVNLGDDPLRSAANRISQKIAAAMNGQQDAEVVELKKSPA